MLILALSTHTLFANITIYNRELARAAETTNMESKFPQRLNFMHHIGNGVKK